MPFFQDLKIAVRSLGRARALWITVGMLAFSVSGRTREFGIRQALGARPHSILTKVLTEGLAIASVGVAVEFLVGFALERFVSGHFAGFRVPGVVTLIAGTLVIPVAAVIASALPAARCQGSPGGSAAF